MSGRHEGEEEARGCGYLAAAFGLVALAGAVAVLAWMAVLIL